MGSFYMESTQINYRRDETVKTVDQKLQELSETSAIDTDIAPVFKSTNTYAPGDMVYYRNKLYVFNVEHTGAWAAADVTATDVTTELSSLKSGLTNVQDDFTDVIGWNHRKNLFDKNATNTSNGFIPNAGLGSDNSTSATETSNVSEYIPVTAGVTYTLQALVGNQSAICFYNSEKTYITGYTYKNQSAKTVTAPTNSAYARFTVNKANIDITQMEVGSTATQYEPYHPIIGTAVEQLQNDVIDLTTALNSAKIYKNDWANNLTVPLGMCTIVMFALTTGANDMYIYNSTSDVLSSIRGSGMTATKNQDNTVTFYSNSGSGRFVALILA